MLEGEVVDRPGALDALRPYGERPLPLHAHAQILEQRHEVRERQHFTGVVDLQT